MTPHPLFTTFFINLPTQDAMPPITYAAWPFPTNNTPNGINDARLGHDTNIPHHPIPQVVIDHTANNISPNTTDPPSQKRRKTSSGPSRTSTNSLNLDQYRTVTDIDLRLHELEKEEIRRIEMRQEALKRRQVKDAELKRKRDAEDDKWKEDESLHEEEENELRHKRKRLKRESMGLADSVSHPEMTLLQPDNRLHRQFQRSSSPTLNNYISSNQNILRRNNTPKRKYNKTERYGQRHGPPDGQDKDGRYVWRRSADGQMVTINCTIQGCNKVYKTWKTLHGLMTHVSKDHKVKLNGREDLLNHCGDVADMGNEAINRALGEVIDAAENGVNGVSGLNGSTTPTGYGMAFESPPVCDSQMPMETDTFDPFATPDPQIPIGSIDDSQGGDHGVQGQEQVFANADIKDTIEAVGDSQATLQHEQMIKAEKDSANGRSSGLSSLFGDNGNDMDREGTMDITNVVRRVTPDDVRIKQLLGGVSPSALRFL